MPDSVAASIELLVLDVDGVLTDGRIHIDAQGVETKSFHVRDGAGIRMWQGVGGEVAIITGRSGMAVRHRATELGIHHVYQGSGRKIEAFGAVLRQLGVIASQAAVIGDDLADHAMMSLCGYPIAVGDAVTEIRAIAEFVTLRPGGRGAVREAIEHLLKAGGRWEEAMEVFL